MGPVLSRPGLRAAFAGLAAAGAALALSACSAHNEADNANLITGKQLHYLNSGYDNMERHRRRAGELFIELHAEDARRRGVAEGDAVVVRNGFGEVRAVCRISDRVRPGIAWMPFGGSLDADGQRRSVNALTPEEPTDWGGGSGLYDAFVEVVPVPVPSLVPSPTA